MRVCVFACWVLALVLFGRRRGSIFLAGEEAGACFFWQEKKPPFFSHPHRKHKQKTKKPTPNKGTFTAGAVVPLTVTITANHGGRMAFSVCPLSRDAATQACFDQPGNYLTR